MRKATPLLFALLLFVPLAACGGGDDDNDGSSSGSSSGTEEEASSGDADEFCDQVDEIVESDLSENLDFEDEDELREAVDVLGDLQDVAPSEIEDEFDTVMDFFDLILDNFDEFNDDENAEALQEEFADEIADFTEATEALDEFSLEECGQTIDGSTEDTSDFDEVEDEIDDGSSDSGDDSGDQELGDAESPPEATEDGLLGIGDMTVDELDDLMGDCEDGDLTACDEVYSNTSVGSPEEEYGSTCGGRIDEGVNGDCELLFG